jgi:hypothetical protein
MLPQNKLPSTPSFSSNQNLESLQVLQGSGTHSKVQEGSSHRSMSCPTEMGTTHPPSLWAHPSVLSKQNSQHPLFCFLPEVESRSGDGGPSWSRLTPLDWESSPLLWGPGYFRCDNVAVALWVAPSQHKVTCHGSCCCTWGRGSTGFA